MASGFVINFPVLAARDAETLITFKPWADALVSAT